MVAVVVDDQLDLQVMVIGCIHCCSFKAKMHGHANEEIKTDFALFLQW